MRRFVDTFAGKALCHLVAMALVVPTVTLTVASRATAQVTQLPSWAVTEFKDLKGANSFHYGQSAADAVASELAKTNRYDVVPQDTVKRSIETLGLASPLDQIVNLSRVGQDVRATTIVAGEVVDYQVRQVGGGKEALVAIRAVAYDVASGLPVNGALVEGESTVRSGNVTNDTLVNDAISQAAALAVRQMSTQQASVATVLNTTDRLALINQGARSGFRTGDSVIITRGAQQIGTGRIGAVEPDQAEMSPERLNGPGISPGDKVRTVFSPPALPLKGYSVFTDKGSLNVRNNNGRRGGRSNNATLISALLVVGLIGVLLGSGNNSNSTSAAGDVTAQASLDNGSPAIRLNWSPNGFYKGTGTSGNGVARWQIYRSDVSPSNPVLVIGNHSTVVDSSLLNNSDFPNDVFQSNQVGGTQCNYASPVTGTRAATPLLTTGRPVYYSIEAVYFVSSLDLPIVPGTTSGTTSTSGTTAGTTSGTTSGTTASTTGTGTTGTTGTTATSGGTGTTSTAGSSSGTNSGNVTSCYFQSGRSSSGQATPLTRPVLGTPNGSTLSNSGTTSASNATFSFTSNQLAGSAGGAAQITQQAILEFSDDPTFPAKYSIATAPTYGSSFTGINTTSAPFNSKKGRSGLLLSVASPIYYRIGIRNATDRPGPVQDSASSRRYIYSLTGQFTRPSTSVPTTPTIKTRG